MTTKLMLAVRDKKRRSRSKEKNTSGDAKNLRIQSPEIQEEILYPSEKINDLLESFNKEIANPIVLYTELHTSQSPQKCLLHHNISTLYCINDEKLLCAGCMYQSSGHKGHKVVPLNKASEQIKANIKSVVSEVEEHLKISNFAIRIAESNMQKAEKQFPSLMQQLHNFYMELHQLLIDRKNQQMKLMSESWSRLRFENSTLRIQMTRMVSFIRQKLDQVSKRVSNEDMTFNKNVVDHLKKIQNVIKRNTVTEEVNNYFQELKKLNLVYDFVKERLVIVEIKNKIIQSYYPTDRQKLTPRSPKKNATSVSKLFKKDQPQKSIEERLVALQQKEQGLEVRQASPKNRHSMNEVLLKSQLANKKRVFERQQSRKSLSTKNGASPKNSTQKSPQKFGTTPAKTPSKHPTVVSSRKK